MPSSLAHRLNAARQRQFVGRAHELALLQSAFTPDELPFQVLYIFGPGGVGKTSLLNAFAHARTDSKAPTVYLDARNIEPTSETFLNVLRVLLDLSSEVALMEALAERSGHHTILIDTYELLAPLDGWLREVFLPQLPDHTLLVLAGRNPPSPEWRAHAGWQTLIRPLSLRNFNADESLAYLTQRHVPAHQQKAVLDFTHGHPLALALIAELFAQRPDAQFQPEAAPDIIKTLLEQFVQKVPGPAHRAALEACALVRVMTESLLAVMLAMADVSLGASESARELFEWLRSLSFIETGSPGLFPHDLAREALIADLRWRNPDWYAELHRRARAYYTTRMQQARGVEQQTVLYDLIFLHRDNSVVRSAFEWQATNVMAEALRASDVPQVLAMVRQHEDASAVNIAAQWLEAQPHNVVVVRDTGGHAMGFVLMLSLSQATAAELRRDPVALACARYLQHHAPLRAGEVATCFRFWMAHDTYQTVSPVQSLIFVNIVRHYLTTPSLAYTFFPCVDPDFWAGVFAYVELIRLPELDFACAGKRYGIYGHDWRVMPPARWMEILGEREIGTEVVAAPTPTESIIVLSELAFAMAVQEAFHDFTRSDKLQHNPLLRSRLIMERAGARANVSERVAALQALLRETSEALQHTPKDAKLYRALYYGYFHPASSQEKASELADVPFSTFRRHAKNGVEHVTDRLWQLEIGGGEK